MVGPGREALGEASGGLHREILVLEDVRRNSEMSSSSSITGTQLISGV